MSNCTQKFEYRPPRFQTDFPICLQCDRPSTGLIHGQCTNISEDGLGAVFTASLDLGSLVNLLFTLPRSSTSTRVAARVVTKVEDSYGFVFLFPSQAQRDSVRRYIASVRSNSSPQTT